MKSNTPDHKPRILVVDDEPDVPMFLQHYAEKFGFACDIVYAKDATEAIQRLNEQCCDAAILDVCLVGLTGISLGREIRKHDSLIPLAYYTNLDDETVRQQAELDRAYFLLKHRFQLSDEGPELLIEIISELATSNPCLPGGVRRNSLGFERKLAETPFKLSAPFEKLLRMTFKMQQLAQAA